MARAGIKLRQSSARVGKFALIKYQRYVRAKQFKRANAPSSFRVRGRRSFPSASIQ